MIIIIPIGIFINLGITILTRDKTALSSVINFSPAYFSLAILFIIIPWFTNILRLKIWTEFFNTKLSFLETMKMVFYAELSAAISPTAIGGAPLKIGLLMQKRVPAGASVTIASIGTLEDIAFLIVAIPIAIVWTAAWKFPIFSKIYEKVQIAILWVGASVIIFVLAAYLIIFIMKKLKPGIFKSNSKKEKPSVFIKLKKNAIQLWHDFKAAYLVIIERGKSRFLITTALTGIQWICRYSVVTALVASLGIPVNPVLFFALQWLVFSMAVFIPTPGATGGVEASFYLIFLSFLPGETIGVITAGWRFISFYSYLAIGGLLYLTSHMIFRFNKKACNEAGELVLADSV